MVWQQSLSLSSSVAAIELSYLIDITAIFPKCDKNTTGGAEIFGPDCKDIWDEVSNLRAFKARVRQGNPFTG